MTTTQFWMVGPGDGTYAYVTGPERDRMLPFGWTDASEPTDAEDFVWVRHEGIDGPARLPFQSLPFWRSNGWAPAAPDAHVDPTKDPAAEPEPKTPAADKPATAAKNPKE